jgi:cysteine synthase A
VDEKMTEQVTILNDIGNTPLLKLNHVTDSLGVDIYVKCEFTNPGGSIKDRMALCMIEEAEKRGELRPGGTIVDQSTGNTGPALSFVGNVKGYEVQIFLPAQLSSAYDSADRIRIAKLYGANVTPIDLNEFMQDADQLQGVERAATFVAIRMKQAYDLEQNNPSYWWANQLCNVDNTKAHRENTGREILQQMDGQINGWVASVGTGGTLLGVAQALKEEYPDLKIAGVVPTDDPRIEWVRSRAVHKALEKFGAPKLRFVIEDILEGNVMDHEITIENADAKHMADRLCREEGLFCGMSSGANVCAAIQMAKTMDKGSRIVTVVVDRRDRYFAEYPNEHYVV